MTSRRFPPPWTVEETQPCFIVRDHKGQALAFVYFDDEPGRSAPFAPHIVAHQFVIDQETCIIGNPGVSGSFEGHRCRSLFYSWINNKNWNGWTALFLVTIILTSVTGFPLPPFGLDPPRMVGILSLILLAIAVLGIYVFKNAGLWRWIFIIAATAALWFDAFVGVIQAFAKLLN